MVFSNPELECISPYCGATSRGVRLSTSAPVGDPDPYPRVFQINISYLDLCRYQPPGDPDSQVKYLRSGRSRQVLMTDPGIYRYS
jgi:hypothetical protein